MTAPCRRTIVLAAATAAATALILVETADMPLRLVYNASASAPLGFYRVSEPEPLRHGDLMLVRLPAAWQAWAASRGYISENLPLMKRLAALQGDHVCGRGGHLLVNGRLRAIVIERDGRGRHLPRWRGCRRLRAGEVLLLMDDKPDSFDSRYFGPLGSEHIVGRLRPLWLW